MGRTKLDFVTKAAALYKMDNHVGCPPSCAEHAHPATSGCRTNAHIRLETAFRDGDAEYSLGAKIPSSGRVACKYHGHTGFHQVTQQTENASVFDRTLEFEPSSKNHTRPPTMRVDLPMSTQLASRMQARRAQTPPAMKQGKYLQRIE